MSTLSNSTSVETKRDFYFSVWRWHFYAGLFVIPFMVVLSITGLLMLYYPTIESVLQHDKIYVEPSANLLSYEHQKEMVLESYTGKITKFMPPKAANLSSQFLVSTDSGQNLKVYVNPYSGKVLGDIDNSNTLYEWANNIHGTLLIGDMGDWLMELAASFSILLTVTGLYLWWPRRTKSQSRLQAIKAAFTPLTKNGSRALWRDLHAIIGVVLVAFILLFCLSGLSWSGIWGGKLVQAWSTFPVDTWSSNFYQSAKPTEALYHSGHQENHASHNSGAAEEMPWNLEQAPMPISGTEYGVEGIPAGHPVNLDTVTKLASAVGFTTYRVALPRTDTSTYMISANTMSGDITDPSKDRTLHIDQYSGKILADFGYADYNLVAKSMAYGVALHSGYMNTWNVVVNTLVCVAIIFLCISGIVMWWKRRPTTAQVLSAPPMPKNLSRWKQASILMLVTSLFMPLASACLFSLLLLDKIGARYLPKLRQVYQ